MHKGKLKIAILIDQLVAGGVQKAAINEARELVKLGHEVILLVLVRLHYKYQYEDLSRGLRVIYLSDFNPPFFRKAIRIPYFAFLTHLHILNPLFVGKYKKILKNVDFIISHGTTTCITASAITRVLKIPYMAFVWDPMIYILEKAYSKTPVRFFFPIIEPITRWYEKSYLSNSTIVATGSRVHYNFIRKNYNVKPLVIYPGTKRSNLIVRSKTNLVLGYSRWELAKNPHLFLWLARKIPNVSFIIAGSWPRPKEEKTFRKDIKKLNLENRVTLISPITYSNLKRVVSESIVWLHPNFEAFGMAGLEMASMGLPIIIAKGSGVTELFREGKEGFFPSEGKPEEFLKYLVVLLKDHKKMKEMGLSAYKTAKKYTWRSHSENVIKNIASYLKKENVVALANAFVATHSIGGGDRFLIELANRVPEPVHITIVGPSIAYHHWMRSYPNTKQTKFNLLTPNLFDNNDSPIALFIAYIIRIFQTILLLPKLTSFTTIYSATDIISDVVPAFVFKKLKPKIRWTGRFFHFIEPPLEREGRLWVNIGSYILQRLSLRLLRESDVLMIDNPSVMKDLSKVGISPKKISLQPGGVDIKSISSTKPIKDFYTDAIFIGRLQAHKGVLDAIDVWQKVVKVKPKARLTLVGYIPPSNKKGLVEKIRKLNLERNIFLTGYLPEREKVYSYLKSAKFLLFLDHEAGFGLVVVEAMAASLPVIAYNLPIFGTIYHRGYLLSEIKNTNSVANHCLQLLTNPLMRKKLGSEAKTESRQFDWTNASINFYNKLKNIKN